jgi:hypothetical protein
VHHGENPQRVKYLCKFVLESVGNWDMKQNNESTNTEIYGAEKKERTLDSNTVPLWLWRLFAEVKM